MSDLVKLSFVGDILIQREQLEAIKNNGNYDFCQIFKPIEDIFALSDYACANLETPVVGLEVAKYTSGCGVFNTPPDILEALKRLGLNFLSISNNHILDCGIQGALKTRESLVASGFDTSGINLGSERREAVFFKEIGGIRCAFLAYTYGTNSESTGYMLPSNRQWLVNLYKQQVSPPKASVKHALRKLFKAWVPFQLQALYWGHRIATIDYSVPDAVPDSEIYNPSNKPYLDQLVSDLDRAKRQADLVFLISHSGGQYNEAPAAYTRFVTDYAVEHGASHVIGTHSHCPQSIRFSGPGNAVTAWSLGNFCSWPGAMLDVPNRLSEYSFALHLHLSRETKRVEKISITPLVSVVSVTDGIARVWRLDDWIKKADIKAKSRLEGDKVSFFDRLACTKYEHVGLGEYEVWF